MQTRVIEGRWWLAGTTNVVAGNLVGDEKGWKLELNGTFPKAAAASLKRGSSGSSGFIFPDAEQTILGRTKDGNPISLEYYPVNGTRIVFNGYNSETYPIRAVYENVHFPDPKQIRFRKVYITIPYLFEWAGETNIENIAIKELIFGEVGG